MEADYTADVDYISKYVEDQAPAWMNYAAAINGYAPVPTRDGFDYCEVGCGKGLTSLILAAIHPEGRFWAIDPSANHIRAGRTMAEAANLHNVTFIEAGVGDEATRSVPRCEFVTAHGLLSWVSEDVRIRVLRFLKDYLKPGGLAMLSYDALPGWAPMTPIREMLLTFAGSAAGDSLQKASAALEYVKLLRDGQTRYFVQYPAVGGIIDEFLHQDPRYLVHELMTPHWQPFYFREVAARVQGVGLAYAGNLKPRLNYLDYMAPAEFRDFLASLPSRTLLETHHDFIANTIFRRDLYAAQVPREGGANWSANTAGRLRFGISRLPKDLPLRGQHQGLEYDVTPMRDRVEAILERLVAGPQDLSSLHSAAGGRDSTFAGVADLVQALVVTGMIFPCPDGAGDAVGWPALDTALVQLAVDEGRAEIPLVCPRLGVGVIEKSVTALVMQSTVASPSADAAADWAIQHMGSLSQSIGAFGLDRNAEQMTPVELKRFFSSAWTRYSDPRQDEGNRMTLLGFPARSPL